MSSKQEILDYLRRNGISKLFHFTDRRNLQSIRDHNGLYSWWYLDKHGITIPQQGGTAPELDMRYGLQDYVRLSFCDDHPMAYHLQKRGSIIKLLEIDIEAAVIDGVLFSNMNATDNNCRFGKGMGYLQLVDLEATQRHYVSRYDSAFKPHQAEVMIPQHLPLCYIKNI